MEEIIKELEEKYNEICAEEIFEIYKLASKHFNDKMQMESCVISKDYRESKKNSSLSTMSKLLSNSDKKGSKVTLEELIAITGFDANLYMKFEREIREKNPERTKILFALKSFLGRFKSSVVTIFVEFAELRRLIDDLRLSSHKQLAIFLDLVHTNSLLSDNEEKDVFITNYEAMLSYPYTHISSNEVRQLFITGKLENFLLDEKGENPLGQKEVLEVFKNTKINRKDELKACLELNRVFSTKVYDLTEEDYKTVRENMKNLSFGDLADSVINQMKNVPRSKNNKKEEPKKVNKEKLKDEKIATSKGSNKVYKKPTNINQAKREINKYFDLDTLELRDSISLSDAIHCLSLMYSIEETNETIEVFLREINREYKKLNPFAFYYCLYEKLEYLSEKDEEVKEYLDMIEYILSEGNLFMCTDEKYEEMKKLIQPEVENIIKAINGNYSYEEKKAKALLKTNEE